MGYENTNKDQYQAVIVDWGLKEVEKLKQLQAYINFEYEDDTGVSQKIRWEGFLMKKDGTANQYTANTLRTCGYTGKNILDLNSTTALNTKKLMSITIEKENYQGKTYHRVKWVNDPNEAFGDKLTDPVKLKGFDVSKFNAELVKGAVKKEIKNYAPTSEPPKMDMEEKLDF